MECMKKLKTLEKIAIVVAALLAITLARPASAYGIARDYRHNQVASNVSPGAGHGSGWQGFSPTWIPGIVTWLDPTRGITTATGVSAWADQVGGPAWTQATGGSQPAYNSAPLHGRATLTFNGSSSRLNSATNFTIGAPSTFWAVVVPRTIDASIRGLMVSKQLAVYTSLSSSKWGTSISAAIVDDALTVGTPYSLGVVIRAAADADLVENGAKANFTTGSAFASRGGASIGSDPSGVQFGNFDLGDVIIVTRALDVAEQARLRTYLGNLWGFAD